MNTNTQKKLFSAKIPPPPVGTEVINQFAASVLYNIINPRLSRKKSTIINTNFSQDDLRAKYADRITSRIFGEYRIIPFVGKDVRMKK